jgi:hypothetical protein
MAEVGGAMKEDIPSSTISVQSLPTKGAIRKASRPWLRPCCRAAPSGHWRRKICSKPFWTYAVGLLRASGQCPPEGGYSYAEVPGGYRCGSSRRRDCGLDFSAPLTGCQDRGTPGIRSAGPRGNTLTINNLCGTCPARRGRMLAHPAPLIYRIPRQKVKPSSARSR